MGSPCALHLDVASRAEARSIADAVVGEVQRLEAKYSRYRDDSLVAAIHRTAGHADGIEVDEETASLLDYAAICHEQSGGRFDITSGVLRRVWDFKSGRVPSRTEIARELALVGWQRVRWDRPRLVLPLAGMEIDFGGIVKEYAVDRIVALCRERGAVHALIDLGGDLGIAGARADGSPWSIGIRDPLRPDSAIAMIGLSTGAVATSGDYERGMTVAGRRYSHVFDARTGWPVEGIASVTVVAPHCVVAGSASTLGMLLGERHGGRFLDEAGLPSLRVLASGEVAGSLARFARGTENRSTTASL